MNNIENYTCFRFDTQWFWKQYEA